MLLHPVADAQLRLITDASRVAVGAVVEQLRSAFSTDLCCTSAELVYSCPLHLPGNFITPSPAYGLSVSISYVAELRGLFEQTWPMLPRQRSGHSIFVSQEFLSCTHMFLRVTLPVILSLPLLMAYTGSSSGTPGLSPLTSTAVKASTADRVKPAYVTSRRPSYAFPVSTK